MEFGYLDNQKIGLRGQKLHAHKGEGIHSDAYKQSIYDRLNNKGREEFIGELDLIKRS